MKCLREQLPSGTLAAESAASGLHVSSVSSGHFSGLGYGVDLQGQVLISGRAWPVIDTAAPSCPLAPILTLASVRAGT